MTAPSCFDNTTIWVVGATGIVGRNILAILAHEWHVPPKQITCFASPGRAGTSFDLDSSHSFELHALTPETWASVPKNSRHFALLATEAPVSRTWLPELKAGPTPIHIIDASSAVRMDPHVPLVIPQINGHRLCSHPQVIAGPNCLITGFLLGFFPFWNTFDVKRIFVASYQAASGIGVRARDALEKDLLCGTPTSSEFFRFPLAHNCIPQIGTFNENGYCQEETKVQREAHKILGCSIPIHATTVRIPIRNGHSLAATLELDTPITMADVNNAIQSNPVLGVQFANPLHDACSLDGIQGTDTVMVSRIRIEPNDPNYLHCFIQFDNIRIGAATNLCRILKEMIENN